MSFSTSQQSSFRLIEALAQLERGMANPSNRSWPFLILSIAPGQVTQSRDGTWRRNFSSDACAAKNAA